ncbi:MAG TPA: DUF2794 domain-containing protein [Hellea balneolensis]|uniref:DUF2794 domain-containing protein n=1 Tax=Hellea balneolensis TaxID=287478 RepID=A0A7C5LXN4_9PROT|nr:DUF2794 domain-containing protein [Hellea balneolensis]
MSAQIIPLSPLRKTKSQFAQVAFQRNELGQILNIYGRMVSHGHWKDYAIDMGRERAVFSVFRRASECPLYQIIKHPALRRKQGQYSVVAPGGLILKRGHDLGSVLKVFERGRFKTV